MGERMTQRRYRMGLVGLFALVVFGSAAGLGATESDGWMQRVEAGLKAR